MIEVEIRGQLTKGGAQKLAEFLRANGEFVESHSREMILLSDYPGYADDPNVREVDIRLRDTNGKCEVMVKRKSHEHNVGRHEHSIPIAGTLDDMKKLAKAFGCGQGLWMQRKKQVFQYNGIEWSIVEAVSDESGASKDIWYYEAELEGVEGTDLEEIRQRLEIEAKKLDLSIFTPEEYLEFVTMLGREVNKRIEW